MKDPLNNILPEEEEELYVSAPSSEKLNDIEKLVNEAVARKTRIDKMKKIYDEAVKQYKELVEKKLPDMMASAGTREFTTDGGVTITIKDRMEGALPKEDEQKRKAALQWLMDNGGAAIIKGEIVVPFDKGEHNFKEEIKRNLTDINADFFEWEEVHHMTLKSFAREKIRNGEEVPLLLLGLSSFRIAEIKGDEE